MPYTITLSDGVTTLITVPDRSILGPSETDTSSNCSLNLVGRGAVNYGLPIAENFVWLLQNFANTSAPIDPLTGQIWYNTHTGTPLTYARNTTLQLYNTSSTWVQIATSDEPFVFTGNVTVTDNHGNSTVIITNGTTAYNNAIETVYLSLGLDRFDYPDLVLFSPTFETAEYSALWHAENLNPFGIGWNNIGTGDNYFLGNTTLQGVYNTIIGNASVQLANGTDSTFIEPGRIVLTINDTLSNSYPQLIFTRDDNSNTGAIFYNDSQIITNFLTGSSNTISLYLDPTSTITDGNNINPNSNVVHTIYHSGNLVPVVRFPVGGTGGTQDIQGSIDLTNNLQAASITVSTNLTSGSLTTGDGAIGMGLFGASMGDGTDPFTLGMSANAWIGQSFGTYAAAGTTVPSATLSTSQITYVTTSGAANWCIALNPNTPVGCISTVINGTNNSLIVLLFSGTSVDSDNVAVDSLGGGGTFTSLGPNNLFMVGLEGNCTMVQYLRIANNFANPLITPSWLRLYAANVALF